MLRALQDGQIAPEGLSIDDFRARLLKQWENAGLFSAADTAEGAHRKVLESVLAEALTDERRLSLSGVGLVKWSVKIPNDVALPEEAQMRPWRLSGQDTCRLLGYLLDELRLRGALELPAGAGAPAWNDVSPWPQASYGIGAPGRRRNVRQWGSAASSAVAHFLHRLLADSGLSDQDKRSVSIRLMREMWSVLRTRDGNSRPIDQILSRGSANGTFRLNSRWLRIRLTRSDETWECDTCASISMHNIRAVCPRNRCPGKLRPADQELLRNNHYRHLYESASLPPTLHAVEHTAQIASDEARKRQEQFKSGDIHLLSSSTTFEVGVDLGDLEAVFVRNVPPEPFNYTQRVGRAGRRETPGLAVTYCRRNPHDLYHYENPEKRIIDSVVQAPRLQVTNTKIVIRHMAATALSAFFKDSENAARFINVQELVTDWQEPNAVAELREFCRRNDAVRSALQRIVPERDTPCSGTLRNFSLGHELVTDVVRLQVPHLNGEWIAYSVGYAFLLGAAERLGVPDTDLNVTIAGVDSSATVASTTASIVLYDNVPGGAGLVAQLESEDIFAAVLRHARERVSGGCGCDSSCYGCLRSYRNQFAHPHLDRMQALEILSNATSP